MVISKGLEVFGLSWEYNRDVKGFLFLDLGQCLHPVCQDDSGAAPARAGAGSPGGLSASGSPSTTCFPLILLTKGVTGAELFKHLSDTLGSSHYQCIFCTYVQNRCICFSPGASIWTALSLTWIGSTPQTFPSLVLVFCIFLWDWEELNTNGNSQWQIK